MKLVKGRQILPITAEGSSLGGRIAGMKSQAEPKIPSDPGRAPRPEIAGRVWRLVAELRALMSHFDRELGRCAHDLVVLGGLKTAMRDPDERISGSQPAGKDVIRHGNSVFLVHGRNLGARERVARFIERLGVDVVVIDELAGEGRTVVESLELHADVSYAVVLLTGDDVGGLNGARVEGQFLRARQNVILELGYFLGKLGRNRVCVLYEKGVEIPTDYAGVLWVNFDELGAWRLSLARELRAAGIRIDLDRIL